MEFKRDLIRRLAGKSGDSSGPSPALGTRKVEIHIDVYGVCQDLSHTFSFSLLFVDLPYAAT